METKMTMQVFELLQLAVTFSVAVITLKRSLKSLLLSETSLHREEHSRISQSNSFLGGHPSDEHPTRISA